eukprot:2307314-Prymnesium_polylepis.1
MLKATWHSGRTHPEAPGQGAVGRDGAGQGLLVFDPLVFHLCLDPLECRPPSGTTASSCRPPC